MKLLTHNMLSSNVKGVRNGFPLGIVAEKVVEKTMDFQKVDYKGLVDASRIMGYVELPDDVADTSSSMLESDEFLKKFHHALLEIHLEEGCLICPESGRKFPASNGIPNMLLHEDEV